MGPRDVESHAAGELKAVSRNDLVLFIHGLSGSAEATWARFPELLRRDSDLRRFHVDTFSYPTSLFRLPFQKRSPGVATLAGALQTQIDNRFADHEDITLVCHSLGGLIAKQYLLDQIATRRPCRVRRALFYGVPNNGAALAKIASMVSWRHSQLRQLCRSSELVQSMSTNWERSRADHRWVTKYVVGALDDVVDEASARATWGNPDVEIIADRGHRDLVKPVDRDDLAYIVLKRVLLSTEPQQPAHGVPGGVTMPGEMRVSMAALLRIERGGRYLLVRSLHRPESFGPFGGVYKYFAEARRELDANEFRVQAGPTDLEHDLRGLIPTTRQEALLAWFNTGSNRETPTECLHRELREECTQVGLSDLTGLDDLRFGLVRRIAEDFLEVPGEVYGQWRLIEVYDPIADTDGARVFLRRLCDHATTSTDLLWAGSQEIIRGRAENQAVVAHHAAYLFGNKRYRSGDPNFR